MRFPSVCVRVCVYSGMHACLHMCLHAWVHALTYVWTVAPGQRSMQSTDRLHLCQFHLGNWLTTIHSVPVTITFLLTGRWCSTTGASISGYSYHSQSENISGLNSAFNNQNRQRLWDCVYWHNLCGVSRTCWTIGSWRCCLCLNFVS